MPGGQGQIWGYNGEYNDRSAALRKAPPDGLILPFGFAEISKLECLSPCLQIRSSSSVLHSSFCHCFIAQARHLGVSCLISPFPSSPTSSASTSLVHGSSKIEPFWTTFFHLTDIGLLHQLFTIATASNRTSYFFIVLSNPGLLNVGSRTKSCSIPRIC